MTRKFSWFNLGTLTASLLACSTNAPLDYRWSKIASLSPIEQSSDTATEPLLSISSNPVDSPNKIKPNDLSDRAGAAYFEQLAKFSQNAQDFIKLAGKSLGVPNEKLDTTSFDRALIVTVSKSSFNPGDRLVWIKITIDPNPNFEFSNYSVASTAYSTVNIDTITNIKSTAYSAAFSPKIALAGAPLGFGNLTASSTNSAANTAQISQQVEQLTAYLDETGKLMIYRESERGIDLTGTMVLKLSIKIKDPLLSSKVEKKYVIRSVSLYNAGKPLPPEKSSITLVQADFRKPEDIKVKAKLEYVARHIVDGAATYTESDDIVQFIKNPEVLSDREFTVVSAHDLVVPRWTLFGIDESVLYVSTPFGDKQVLFSSYEDAQQFVKWLSEKKPTHVGGMMLKTSGRGGIHRKSPLSTTIKYPIFSVYRADN